MFAIFRLGDKQYRAEIGKSIKMEKIEAEEGSEFELKDLVMLVDEKSNLIVDKNTLSKYKIIGNVLKQYRDKKILVFKKKRRKGYARTKGHRQYKTLFEVKSIVSNV